MTVAQAQTAALALGTEITPEDAQNLLKAVEGSGRAGDPTAVGKMFDAYHPGQASLWVGDRFVARFATTCKTRKARISGSEKNSSSGRTSSA